MLLGHGRKREAAQQIAECFNFHNRRESIDDLETIQSMLDLALHCAYGGLLRSGERNSGKETLCGDVCALGIPAALPSLFNGR
jgi:hypothetical protein